MKITNYDQALAELEEQANALDQPRQVLVFVVLASGLLRLYQEFPHSTGWGNYSALESGIDAAEKFSLHTENTDWPSLLAAIEVATPMGTTSMLQKVPCPRRRHLRRHSR